MEAKKLFLKKGKMDMAMIQKGYFADGIPDT